MASHFAHAARAKKWPKQLFFMVSSRRYNIHNTISDSMQSTVSLLHAFFFYLLDFGFSVAMTDADSSAE